MSDVPTFDAQIDGLLLEVVTDYAINEYASASAFRQALEDEFDALIARMDEIEDLLDLEDDDD